MAEHDTHFTVRGDGVAVMYCRTCGKKESFEHGYQAGVAADEHSRSGR